MFQAPDLSDDQPSLETVTSMDQLIQLFYPQHSLVQHCMRKKSWRASSSSPSFSTSSTSPLSRPGSEDFWVPLREEALYRVDGTLGGNLDVFMDLALWQRGRIKEGGAEKKSYDSKGHIV